MSEELTTRSDRAPETEEPVNNRRRFLARGAAVAAAAAASGVALAKPAAAANGDSFILGVANNATADTRLNGSRLIVDRSSGISLWGQNGSGTGVVGEAGDSAGSGIGVRGKSLEGGVGVYGEVAGTGSSTGGVGVRGRGLEDGSVGVWGEGGSTSVGGTGLRGTAALGPSLLLDSTSLTMPPSSGSWRAGSFVNRGGDLWFCYGGGTGSASRWVKLSGAPVILDSSYRAYDSRAGSAPHGVKKGQLQPRQTRSNIDLKVNGGANAIPSGISSVIVNVTCTNTSSQGYVGVFKNGTPFPGTSSVNWFATGSNIANTTIVAVDSSSRVAVRGMGTTDLILDVIGYMP